MLGEKNPTSSRFLRGSLNFVLTKLAQEGSQYVRGFGGIGGMLRYTVDFQVNRSHNLLSESKNLLFQSMQCDNLDDADYDLDDY